MYTSEPTYTAQKIRHVLLFDYQHRLRDYWVAFNRASLFVFSINGVRE